METKYNIRRIAVAITNEACETKVANNNNTFIYKNIIYEKLVDFCIETIIYDISLNSDISLNIVEENERQFLYIVLDLSKNNKTRRGVPCRIRLLQLSCKNDVSFLSPINKEDETECNKDLISDKVFDLLKQKHDTDVLRNFDEIELSKCLRPILRPYQAKAVKWMLDVESVQQEIEHFKEIQFIDCPNQTFYINQYNYYITPHIPVITLPKGGILADEMGLGKTIEMLSLILLKQKLDAGTYAEVYNNLDDGYNNLEDLDGSSLPKIMKTNEKFLCICFNKVKKHTIKCVECNILQHIKCVRKYAKPTDPHICPSCWSNKTKLIPSRATVIVTPATIKKQWHNEIMKHVILPLKVLMYSGVSDCWISPSELADYDIILTDYSILNKEIYFSSENKSQHNFRNSKKYMRTESSLLKVLWYRVCLDEAQMVESANTKASKMVKLLPTIHRWAVTGTPIQKSLEDIRGLLEFLEVFPIYGESYWTSLVNKFYKGDNEPLIDVLGKIMWRSCKKTVMNELDIPKQLENIHYINFDDAEKLFYSNDRQICAQNFNEKVSKLILDSPYSIAISKFDAQTLRKILEPLKKLRQDCNVPMLLKFQNNQSHVKKLLQPQELLEHLKTSNELECKNQIRRMTSNYNGLAAIHMIREDYKNAVRLYRNVIGLAKEFSGPLSVDSLLQIHALHNMQIACQLDKNVENLNLEEIAHQQGELEWKYINTYYEKYADALESWLRSREPLNKKLKIESIQKAFIDMFEEIKSSNLSDIFLMKIQEEDSFFFNTMFNEYTRSVNTIKIYIFNWLQSIFSTREQLKAGFNNFVRIMSMIKAKEKLNPTVSNFVKTVFECHLKNIRGEDDESEEDEINEVICELCKSKITLCNYECLIFDKYLDERTQVTDGTWNPCMQENILKLTLYLAKNKNLSLFLIDEFEQSLKFINLVKKEYKDLFKLWIEIEYIVKAYDELEMCKLRLTAIEDSLDIDNKKSSKNAIYQIPKYQIDDTFEDLSTQLNQSKMEFYKKLGRLKYVKHLEQNAEPDNCPICKSLPNSKYCVLDCGHIMCVFCLNEMTRHKQNSLSFNCAICRAKVNNVFFVTGKQLENEISIKGAFSSKIQKILFTIIKLKMDDPTVKILIFSHWQSILKIISTALNENAIEHRLMWSTKSIEEFKNENLNITCMLMLLAHGSKGLNLIESTHVFLVEPILNIAEELQAISRVHRIGQTKVTTVHRFIVRNTIEEKIFNTMSKLKSLDYNNLTIEHLSKFICEDNDYEN